MNHQTYRLDVRRRRGAWHATVPDLPGRDAPTFTSAKIGNLTGLAIQGVAAYLGVDTSVVDIEMRTPVRITRKRSLPTYAQVFGAAVALSGAYLLGGLAVTLLVTGVAITALGVLREGGKI